MYMYITAAGVDELISQSAVWSDALRAVDKGQLHQRTCDHGSVVVEWAAEGTRMLTTTSLTLDWMTGFEKAP